MADKVAFAQGRDMSISLKQTIEICNWIRGKRLVRAKAMLQGVVDMKTAVPYRRFMNGAGHQRGKTGPAQFPHTAAAQILRIVKLAEANAANVGLSTANLMISRAVPNKASKPKHYGRRPGLEMKRAHLLIEVKEGEPAAKKRGKGTKKDAAPAQEKAKSDSPSSKKTEKKVDVKQ